MNRKVLCVDDESNILASYQRQVRKEFELETALGGEEGIEKMMTEGPFAVIVSDMRMPNMDGVQFLSRVKASAPESVRMMLTGNADLTTAVHAVNQGNIFRFLLKPCPPEILIQALEAGIEQYQLIRAEKDLLKNTLTGSIRVLIDILGIVNPSAFSRASRIKRYVKYISQQLHLTNQWQFEVAAMLSQIGCVTLPAEILDKVFSQVVLTEQEKNMYFSYPETGFQLLSKIPRLEAIAQIIKEQNKSLNQYSQDETDPQEKRICLGAQILKVATDLDQLVFGGMTTVEALYEMGKVKGKYNPRILNVFSDYEERETEQKIQMVMLKDLCFGMIAGDHILDIKGTLLVSKGQEISYPVIARLENFAKQVGVREPIRMVIPTTEEKEI